MMVRSILVAIALIACVHAVPTPNDIVPETKFVEGAATSAHASAKQIVTEMIQAGSDWTACSELANTTRDEVEESVKTKQDMLDELDKGCGCAALGQGEVTRTLTEMNAAFSAVTVAETALETATNAQVQLASQEYQLLRSGACGWIQTDVAYQTALATYNKAVTTLATARSTYTLSVTAHTEAVTEAARLKLECECATQSAHAAAWADANADNNANDAAWAQAHHIDCVIEHISGVDCAFGPAPGLTQPTLCDDIESVSCAAESGSAAGSTAPPVLPTGAPTDAPTDAPSDSPTDSPTNAPTDSPTDSPTNAPSDSPTNAPSDSPTNAPSDSPTDSPTNAPSDSPTYSPSNAPSASPSASPSDSPTKNPTDAPTYAPTPPPTCEGICDGDPCPSQDNGSCANGGCYRTEREGAYKCCGDNTFFCASWTSGDCKADFHYCSGYLGH